MWHYGIKVHTAWILKAKGEIHTAQNELYIRTAL